MKTWLITGCSSGIGKGIAKAVLESGDQAIVTARNKDKVMDIVEAYPEAALAVSLDVCSQDSIKNAVKEAYDKFGTIDVLVNNAGYGYRSAVEEGEIEAVQTLYQTNLFGPIELIKAVLPKMREQKSGYILNVTSIAAARSAVGSGYYASSKAALELLTNGLMKELAPLGIKAMVVQPGAFRTRFYDGESLQGTKAQIGDYEAVVGKSRPGNFENKHQQAGDPDKAGKVIVDVVHNDDLPEILTLGKAAVTAVKSTLEAKIAELDKWAEVQLHVIMRKESRKMKRLRFGKTDMYVNAIGLGCMGLTHASGLPTPKEEAVEILRKAHDMGYDFYDTAECYTGVNPDGSTAYNEEVVGEAVKPFRKDIILCTKFGVKHMGDHLEFDSSPETIRKSLEGSLKKLQTDYVDIYYQHRIDPKVEPEVVAGVMKELIEEGKIKAWGISETNEEYLRRAHAVCPVTVIENRYSMMARWHENLMPVCKELGITYVAFSPLANGALTGAYQSKKAFGSGEQDFRPDMPQYSEEGIKKTNELLEVVSQIGEKHHATNAQMSLAWMINKYDFIIPIPGSRKLDRLQSNFEAGNVELSQEEVKTIDDKLNTMEFKVFGGH